MPITYQLMGIPEGKEGTRQTLRLMAALARRQSTSPLIRELAVNLVSKVPERNYYAEARTLLRFVQSRIRYVRDVAGVETLQPPVDTLRLGAGDCDDKCILFASLMLAIGHPVKFVAMGEVKGHFSHVFCETKVGQQWLACETIYNWPLGKGPRRIAEKMEHSV